MNPLNNIIKYISNINVPEKVEINIETPRVLNSYFKILEFTLSIFHQVFKMSFQLTDIDRMD